MEALVASNSSSAKQSHYQCQRRRNATYFSYPNHDSFFFIPVPSSSVFHHQQQPQFQLNPTQLKNRNRKLNRSTKDSGSYVSKRHKTNSGKEETASSMDHECLIITSTDPLGPDPSELPKEIPRVLKSPPSSPSSKNDGLERFSGSVCAHSPHPSSLPLPKFSTAHKISCNAEAGGVDIGATIGLRSLLGLRLLT